MNEGVPSTTPVRVRPTTADLAIETIGPGRFSSPVAERGDPIVDERRRVLVGRTVPEVADYLAAGTSPPSFEIAGARRLLAHDPATVACGIVTVGGLCPGLNDVVRSIVLTLVYAYGVRRIVGFRYGYAGLAADGPHTDAAEGTLAGDVMRGLSALPKQLSSKYFYDAQGSRLFERIMRLPAYYPTRVEARLLRRHARALLAALTPTGAPMELLEPGSGDGRKTLALCREWLKAGRPRKSQQ